MSFKITYYAIDGKHLTLNADGTIEIYQPSISDSPIIIDYKQSKILKMMIQSELELEDAERK